MKFRNLIAAYAMLSLNVNSNALSPKPKRKCRLKGCDILTSHNGGYCCAEHHAMDKQTTQ